jgi:hypothetical protein
MNVEHAKNTYNIQHTTYNRKEGGIYIYIYIHLYMISAYFYNKHTTMILEGLAVKPTAGVKDSSGCVTRLTLFRPEGRGVE